MAKRACDVPCEIHGFEMQPDMALSLENQFAALRKLSAHTTFVVHRLGIGAQPAIIRAEPMAGTDKKRTLTLSNGVVTRKTRARPLDANVTSLDVWAKQRLDLGGRSERRIFYVKVLTLTLTLAPTLSPWAWAWL